MRRRPYARRWTAKRRFARRRPRDLAVSEPGALVQLDTVYVNLTPTKAIKHFTAYDPVAKWTVGKAFNRATAHAAASFLDKILADMPFPVKAIQVDGGAEFMAECEAAVSFHGPPSGDTAKPEDVKIPLQGHFASRDDFWTPAVVDAFEQGLKAAKKEHEFFRYDADHAFMNEQRMAVHDRHAAELAWGRATAFLHKHLG